MRRRLFPLLVLLSILLAVPAAAVTWSNDPAANTPVCASSGDQWNPVTVSDNAGGVVVAWYDWRNGNADIYAQRFDATGRPLWTAGGVLVCGAAGDQTNVRLISDGGNGAILVWQDARGATVDVYARRVTGLGVPLWTTDGVAICISAGNQTNPSIDTDGDRGAIIAWQDLRGGVEDIYVQHLIGNGHTGWTANGVAVCTAAYAQTTPVVVADAAAGAVLVWRDRRSNTSEDVYAQHVSSTGTMAWAAGGVAVCTATGDQTDLSATTDNSDGAIVTWMDYRSGGRDVYAQRITAEGAAAWTANGVAIAAMSGDQWTPRIVADGAGGSFLTWFDWRGGNAEIYAQHLDRFGAAMWTAGGVLVCAANGDQVLPVLAPDGSGGLLVAWQDPRANVGLDVYAQRLNSSGVAQWTANGVALCTAAGDQTTLSLVADGAGGAIVAWLDLRGSDRDVYLQRVDRWGYLGPLPTLASLRDVPADQGGHLSVYWNASALDAFPAYTVYDYQVYVRYPGQAAYALYATQLAAGLAGYSMVIDTAVDSTGAYNLRTAVYVRARDATAAKTWDAAADSGYSVDNLSPPAPAQFTGTYAAGGASLHWASSPAEDFAAFELYRGATADFVPAPGCLVATVTGTDYVDAGAAPAYYKLAAVDAHGNPSPFATLLPDGTAGAGGPARPRVLALAAPAPNPVRSSATLRLALPRAARVTLDVFDQQGRRVRGLLDARLDAGEHAIAWDGRDDAGRAVASALYFVRLDADGLTLTRRVAVVR